MEEAYLGIDVGSISTKGVIIGRDNDILAGEYIWTQGDPIGAVKELVGLLEGQFASRLSPPAPPGAPGGWWGRCWGLPW